MKSIARKPTSVAPRWHGTFSLSLSLPVAAIAILSGPDVAEAAAAPRLSAAGGTTLYVDGERGDDSGCLDGLSPDPSVDPSEPCPFPGAPWPGPFKTITKALTTIELNPAIGAGAPFTVRIAARWHEGLATPYIYGNSPGAANYSGETFPLMVPPRTQLRANAASSEREPGTGVPIRVIIEGPVPPSTNAVDTLVFFAGGTDNFTPEGGLDGTEIHLDYGMEVRRGGRSVYLFADSAIPPRWPGITGGPPSPTLPAMSVKIENVWFSGGSAYGLDAHILHKDATGRFTVSNCRFSTDTTVTVDPNTGQPVPHLQHTGQALILKNARTGPIRGGLPREVGAGSLADSEVSRES